MAIMQVAVGKELGRVDVDLAKLQFRDLTEVQTWIVGIGLRNILMDSHAGETLAKHKGDKIAMRAAALERVETKKAAMYAGDARVAREGGTRTTDPLEAAVKEEARAMLKGMFKEDQKEEFKAAMEMLCADADVRAAAEAKLAQRAALAEKLAALKGA